MSVNCKPQWRNLSASTSNDTFNQTCFVKPGERCLFHSRDIHMIEPPADCILKFAVNQLCSTWTNSFILNLKKKQKTQDTTLKQLGIFYPLRFWFANIDHTPLFFQGKDISEIWHNSMSPVPFTCQFWRVQKVMCLCMCFKEIGQRAQCYNYSRLSWT